MYQMAEFPELKAPAIIAVMGTHQTAEREFICRMVGRWARCSIYDIKGALDSLSEEEEEEQATAGQVDEEKGARLQRVSFDVICRMAEYHLPRYIGGKGCVIVSSTFFNCKLQLDRLIEMTTRPRRDWPRRRLLIIECRRKNLFQWEQSVERDIEWKEASLGEKPKWHEPKSWKDVEKSILEFEQEGCDEYFLTLARSHPHVKKLTVDPFQDLSPDSIPLFEKAITHLLIACDMDEYQGDQSCNVVEYAIWRRQQLEGRVPFRVPIQRYVCSLGGCIFRLTENLHQEAICEVCERRVTSNERAYYCQFCNLSFHELCAIKTTYDGSWHTSKFPETHACYSCIDRGKGFSDECTSCIFRTFIKSRILAPVLKHECDEHNLTLCVLQGLRSVRLGWCNACGLPSHLAGYCCNICKSRYHWECLKLPLETKSEHGGHLHDINLQFSCAKEDEHEWCLACFRDIDPETWVYICLQCDYVAHLYCVFPSIAEESQYEFE